MSELLLSMEGIQKYFPGVHALDDARLELRSGEVHALVGENGAGKSTLMKVLTGIYKRDSGIILYKGKEVDFSSPKEAQAAGIGIIHQELNLMPHLTVAENIYIGREPTKGLLLDKKKANKDARELMKSLGLDIDPTVEVRKLSVAKQQMVEIAKAITYDSEVLIMDEPSAALTDREIHELFRFIRDLKGRGHGIIYISHRLDELPEISDRITVMRDGQYVDTVETGKVTKEQIISMMVGRVIYETPKQKSSVPPDAPVILEVGNLQGYNVKNVSFSLRRGEILGFAGLVGAGRTETMRALFGADPIFGGKIVFDGREVTIGSPQDAVGIGIGYLSEDRKALGLMVGLSVRDNSVMSTLDRFSGKLFVNDKKTEEVTRDFIEKLSIKAHSTKQLVKLLSGGNQQKVVVAKSLAQDPSVIIFDEPTRGVDVSAIPQIHQTIRDLAAQGKAVMVISSYLPEILAISDRILVARGGRVVEEMSAVDANAEKIMYAAIH